jgi:thiol-disulfide isomerase/thioredoxin
MNFRSIFSIALVASALASYAQDAPEAKPVTLKVGDAAPQLKVAKWVKGTPITNLKDGKIHVVEFWATWCGPCRVSIPHLTELAAKYKGKVDFVGVDSFEQPSPTYMTGVEKFVKDMGDKMAYNVAADGQGANNYMATAWMDAAGQGGIPTAFVVDKSGTIAWIGHPMDGLDEVLGKMVAGKFDVKTAAAEQQAEATKAQKQQELMQPFVKAMSAQDHEGALLELDSVLKEDPSLEPQLAMIKFDLLLETDEPNAYVYAKDLLTRPSSFDPIAVFNNGAWAIVGPESTAKHPDLEVAEQMAAYAVKQMKEKDPFSMDTLAYIYFKKGEFKKAYDLQAKAVAVAKVDVKNPNSNMTPETLKEMTDRLAEFKAKAGA